MAGAAGTSAGQGLPVAAATELVDAGGVEVRQLRGVQVLREGLIRSASGVPAGRPGADARGGPGRYPPGNYSRARERNRFILRGHGQKGAELMNRPGTAVDDAQLRADRMNSTKSPSVPNRGSTV